MEGLVTPARTNSKLAGQRVLVTGAYGLIGSWLVRGLIAAGAEVCVIRRDKPLRSALMTASLEPRISVVEGDICAEGLAARALVEYEIQSVFHLAAQTVVGAARRSPLSTFETNIRGTWTVLEACRQYGVESVIVASSDKAYGPQRSLPYHEEMALKPRSPYEASKAAVDVLARSYWHTWQLPVAATRLANVYGGGDANGSRLVPEAVIAALSGRAPVIRSDGTSERDFLYVEDAVAAYMAVWDALAVGRDRHADSGGVAGEAFNAGGGAPHSVLEVVELACRLAGTDVEPDIRGSGTPRGEIDRQWVDYSKLHALTGWEPEVSLEEGLRRTIDWYRAHPEWIGRKSQASVPIDAATAAEPLT
ncbi:MAG: dTDP-glucose 4,6-dehydratase [Solirubrobacteraceae bacterium]